MAAKEDNLNVQHMILLGAGYTSQRLATALLAKLDAWQITGTTRDPTRFNALLSKGITPILFDSTTGDDSTALIDVLQNATHVLVSIPPNERGDLILQSAIGKVIGNLKNIKWVGILGTTGVYGDYEGKWVNEDSELRATAPRSKARILAEEQWLATGLPVHLFRIAGIYGPGKSTLDSLQAGKATRVFKEGSAFSRIHVDDLVQIILASIAQPKPGRVYNCADDEPEAQEKVVAYGAELLGITAPPLVPIEQANLSPMGLSFYQDSRRVSNSRIKEELNVVLRFKSYREGLQSIVAQQTKPSKV